MTAPKATQTVFSRLCQPAAAFYFFATNLDPADTDTLTDIYVKKLLALGVPELIQALVGSVMNLNLNQGISKSRDAKLATVERAIGDANANNDAAAVNSLQAFINEVQTQSGKKIPQGDADALIAAVNEIIALLL